MNTRISLLVLLVAVGIGLFVIIRMNTAPSTPTGIDRTNERLLDPGDFHPDRVTAMNIEWAGGEKALFQKDGNVWRQTSPVTFRMQEFAMRRLATAVADLTVSKTYQAGDLEGEGSLAALDLDPPAATIRYTLSAEGDEGEATETTIYLGQIFVGGQAYTKLKDDDRVYVVPDDLHKRLLQMDVKEWRDRTIFDGLSQEMSRINIENHDEGATLSLNQVDGTWKMIDPVTTTVDVKAMGTLVQNLIGASIRAFVSDSPEDIAVYGLDAPQMRVMVETDRTNEDGSISTDTQTLLLGNPIGLTDKSRYAKLKSTTPVFTVNAAVVGNITKPAESLLSKVVVDASPEDIGSVTIDGPAGKFDLARTTEGGWRAFPTLVNANAFEVSTASVEALLARLTSDQEGAEFGKLAEEDVVMRIVVRGFDDSTLGTFAIGTIGVNGAFRVVFDDGSGVLRYTDNATLPDFDPQKYVSDPGAPPAAGEGVVTNPDDVSK